MRFPEGPINLSMALKARPSRGCFNNPPLKSVASMTRPPGVYAIFSLAFEAPKDRVRALFSVGRICLPAYVCKAPRTNASSARAGSVDAALVLLLISLLRFVYPRPKYSRVSRLNAIVAVSFSVSLPLFRTENPS